MTPDDVASIAIHTTDQASRRDAVKSACEALITVTRRDMWREANDLMVKATEQAFIFLAKKLEREAKDAVLIWPRRNKKTRPPPQPGGYKNSWGRQKLNPREM